MAAVLAWELCAVLLQYYIGHCKKPENARQRSVLTPVKKKPRGVDSGNVNTDVECGIVQK